MRARSMSSRFEILVEITLDVLREVHVIVVLWFSKVYGYCTLSVVKSALGRVCNTHSSSENVPPPLPLSLSLDLRSQKEMF